MPVNQDFLPGQRCISDTESELGLGMVTDCDHRSVSVAFLASDQTRTYARDGAPLTRVRFSTGDTVRSEQGWAMQVEAVHEEEGLLIYQGAHPDSGEAVYLPETRLDPLIQFNDARSRLFHGQFDDSKWFALRRDGLQLRDRAQAAPTWGLVGARISLVPHQLFIAAEVADRFAPRVLLADEVGLGKTIEACLILHRQLLTGRVQRVLIIVPEPLVNQWLVELLRRFNLRFSVFDDERCTAMRAGDPDANPFAGEQLVLGSLDLFDDPQHRDDAVAAGWDLVVIDEAHHIEWHPQRPSDHYRFVERLGNTVPGMLLLTATPEQLGEQGHFARLRLLDPARFSDFTAFIDEQQRYWRISKWVDQLLAAHAPLPAAAAREIGGLLGQQVETGADAATRRRVVSALIDRHGTSRVLFRNTRANISGFPPRRVHRRLLDAPTDYIESWKHGGALTEMLAPELSHPQGWTEIDPRVGALVGLLGELGGQKLLVICAHSQTVVGLERVLRERHGIKAAVFHERLSIVARDRAAAFFAATDGSQVLLCSEIGSEGRNFQFAHHLLLYDLPFNSDLLEQRIGRLDRIGQQHEIQIHVACLAESPQSVLLRWYDEGINALARTCPVGQSVMNDLEPELMACMKTPRDTASSEELLRHTRELAHEKNLALERGRDRLLEISSFDGPRAQSLQRQIDQATRDHPPRDYLLRVFDAYGVDFEDKDAHSYIVRPSDHMQTAHFPGLKSDGLSATFERDFALAHEDTEFLTWEHPLTRGALDLVLNEDHGKVAAATIEFGPLPRGTVLVETVHTLELIAPNAPELRRFLSGSLRHLLVDESLRDLSKLLTLPRFSDRVADLGVGHARRLAAARKSEISAAIDLSSRIARDALDASRQQAARSADDLLQREQERLQALRAVKASVRDAEIELAQTQRTAACNAFRNASVRLDAIRLILVD
jgi:ATP-dependent helicase HepA